jgi:glycine oxidase
MTKSNVDHIIVGLGLSGAALSWQLISRGHKVVVFDVAADNRSSAEAAGLFNPVTGKLLNKTWIADTLFPYLHDFYSRVERLAFEKFFHPGPVYIPFRSVEEQNDWANLESDPSMASHISGVFSRPAFAAVARDELGGVLLKSGGFLHVSRYIATIREKIREKNTLRGQFQWEKLRLSGNGVEYEDLRARSVIFCDGLHAKKNDLTSWLPLHPLKGQTIDISLDRELQVLFNRGIYIVPAGNNRYKVGATYERTDVQGITAAGRVELEERLRSLLRIPFEVTGQHWGFRPTTPDRRPLLGPLPRHRAALVFNGMGTKGVSLTPYFSGVLADYLEGVVQIPPEVNIDRFYALSSKSRD